MISQSKARYSSLLLMREFLGKATLICFVLGVFCGFGLFISEVALAFCIQLFLYVSNLSGNYHFDIPKFLEGREKLSVAMLLVLSGSLRGIFSGAAGYLRTACLEYFLHHQRTRIIRWSFHSSHASGNRTMALLQSTLSGAGTTISSLLACSVSCINSFCILLLLLKTSTFMTLTVLSSLVILLAPAAVVQRKARAHGKKSAVLIQQALSRVALSIKNLLLFRIFGTVELEQSAISQRLDFGLNQRLRFQMITGFSVAFTHVATVIDIALAIWISNLKADLSPAILISYFYLLFRLLQQFPGLLQNIASINLESHFFRTLFQWFKEEYVQLKQFDTPFQSEGSLASTFSPLSTPVGWRLNRVTYRYTEDGKEVISQLSLVIPAGSTYILIGPSGSGKSTLLQLLLCQIYPQEGSIDVSMDGTWQPLIDNKSTVLKNLGYIGPESYLLEGTLYENLVYGMQNAPSDEEIRSALLQAECGFVYKLPQGLHSRISFLETGLSAGQKQRISLARALLRRPKVLVLDEATSHLDFETEEAIVSTLSKLKGEVTMVIATHRRAVLRIADYKLDLASENCNRPHQLSRDEVFCDVSN